MPIRCVKDGRRACHSCAVLFIDGCCPFGILNVERTKLGKVDVTKTCPIRAYEEGMVNGVSCLFVPVSAGHLAGCAVRTMVTMWGAHDVEHAAKRRRPCAPAYDGKCCRSQTLIPVTRVCNAKEVGGHGDGVTVGPIVASACMCTIKDGSKGKGRDSAFGRAMVALAFCHVRL